jgi:hypothetical protein
MARKQAALKLAILLMAPVSTLAALGAYAGTFWFYFSQQKFRSASTSPSKRFRVVVVERLGDDGCGSSKSTFVVVERRFGVFKTGEFAAFCLGDDAGNLSLKWTGPDELTIDCLNCPATEFQMYGSRWGRATFRYEFGPEGAS